MTAGRRAAPRRRNADTWRLGAGGADSGERHAGSVRAGEPAADRYPGPLRRGNGTGTPRRRGARCAGQKPASVACPVEGRGEMRPRDTRHPVGVFQRLERRTWAGMASSHGRTSRSGSFSSRCDSRPPIGAVSTRSMLCERRRTPAPPTEGAGCRPRARARGCCTPGRGAVRKARGSPADKQARRTREGPAEQKLTPHGFLLGRQLRLGRVGRPVRGRCVRRARVPQPV